MGNQEEEKRQEQPQSSGHLIKSSGFKVTKDVFEDIVLTKEEEELALYEARKAKSARLFADQYAARIREERKYVKLDSFGIRAFALKKFSDIKNKDFKLDDYSEPILNVLAAYFSEDKYFTSLSSDYSFKKGIALFGNVGVGKTMLMKMFGENSVQSFSVKRCADIADEYSNWNNKLDLVCPTDKHYIPIPVAVDGNKFGHRELGTCFDDLGTEDIPAKNYGKDKNIMADIFLRRYENKSLPYNMTHFTTNLPLKTEIVDGITVVGIDQTYGTRVYDRMKEMFNIVQFSPKAPSRR